MLKIYHVLIAFFIIIEISAIVLYVTKQIDLKLFCMLKLLSVGMITLQKYNQFKKRNIKTLWQLKSTHHVWAFLVITY